MAWLTAPVLGTGGNEPISNNVIVPNSGKLAQGALDERHWISPLDTNEILGVFGTRAHTFIT